MLSRASLILQLFFFACQRSRLETSVSLPPPLPRATRPPPPPFAVALSACFPDLIDGYIYTSYIHLFLLDHVGSNYRHRLEETSLWTTARTGKQSVAFVDPSNTYVVGGCPTMEDLVNEGRETRYRL